MYNQWATRRKNLRSGRDFSQMNSEKFKSQERIRKSKIVCISSIDLNEINCWYKKVAERSISWRLLTHVIGTLAAVFLLHQLYLSTITLRSRVLCCEFESSKITVTSSSNFTSCVVVIIEVTQTLSVVTFRSHKLLGVVGNVTL